jgi:hypothetical protein
MHRPHLLARAGAILAVAVTAAAGQIALAPVVSANASPAITFTAPTVVDATATVGFTVNRAANAVASVTCTLTDPTDVVTTVPCGPGSAGPVRRSTGYTTTLTDLAAGDYRYAATLTLTDGGRATSSESFTVAVVEPEEFAASQDACRALPGSTFVARQFWWQQWSCDFDAVTAEAGAAAATAATPLCLADGGYGLTAGFTAPGRYELSCWLLF